jgi:hypothetical protein
MGIFRLAGLGSVVLLLLLWFGISSGGQTNSACTVTITPDATAADPKPIQKAIDQAAANAVLCLSDGTYVESLLIGKDNLTLRALNLEKAVINGSITVQGAKRVAIEGLVLQRSTFGVKLEGGEFLTLVNNRIEESAGRGVALTHVGLAVLENNTIQGHSEAGLFASLESVVRLERNQIYRNGRDGVTITGSKADLRENQIYGNVGCGVRADLASIVTGHNNRLLNNTEKDLCGRFPDGFVTSSRIAVLDETEAPSNLLGRFNNSVEPVLQLAQDRDLTARRITRAELASGALNAYTVLVLPDNAPPGSVQAIIEEWWSRGNHLIAIDSAIVYIVSSGLLFPELRGRPVRESKGAYWDYASSGSIMIQKEHSITAGFKLNQEIFSEKNNALLTISRLPKGADVLAFDKMRPDQAAIVLYQKPSSLRKGAGTLILIGPDENIRFLKTIIGNALAFSATSGL